MALGVERPERGPRRRLPLSMHRGAVTGSPKDRQSIALLVVQLATAAGSPTVRAGLDGRAPHRLDDRVLADSSDAATEAAVSTSAIPRIGKRSATRETSS